MLKLLISYTCKAVVYSPMIISIFIFDDLDFLILNKKTGLKNPVSKTMESQESTSVEQLQNIISDRKYHQGQ